MMIKRVGSYSTLQFINNGFHDKDLQSAYGSHDMYLF